MVYNQLKTKWTNSVGPWFTFCPGAHDPGLVLICDDMHRSKVKTCVLVKNESYIEQNKQRGIFTMPQLTLGVT